MNAPELPRALETAGPAAADGRGPSPALRPAALQHDYLLAAAEIEQALGQTVSAALDLRNWDESAGLETLLTRVRDAIGAAVLEEGRLADLIRRHVLSEIDRFPDAPALAGVYRVDDRFLR